MGLDVTALVMIRTRHHSKTWLEQFRSLVRGIPQVVDFYRIAGDYDYALKIVCRTIAEFDVVYQRMISTIEIETVTSYLAMEVIESQRPTPVSR
jgi:Lrp/AsnC family transcriptional regulator